MKTKRNLIQICLLAAVLLPALTSEATTFVVTNTVDGGTGSLRQLVLSAAPGDTITFATNLSGSTLTLFAQLPLNNSVTIDASALPGGIQIRGQGFERIFFVLGGATVVLSSLTLTNGNDQNDSAGGGGIYNQGTLTVDRCTLTGNNANNLFFGTAGGGAIFNSGLLTLNECTLAGNHSDNDSGGNGGGAIYNSGTLNVNQCTLTTNSADFSGYGGGGIYNYSGTLNIYNSIVAGNSAIGGSGADIFSFSSIAFTGANLVEDFSGNFSGNFPINADPRLEPLGNYSGPTPTMPPLPGSPAINACHNTADFTTDQRGVPRIIGGIADIGSVKLAPPGVSTLPATAVVNSNATLNATVNPNTLATTAWFAWGVTNNPYANQTTPLAVAGGNTNTALAFSNNLTGLTPGVVYHCSALASNADGLAGGGDVLFGSAPVVTLIGAASMTNECHSAFTDPGATNAAHLPVTVTGRVNTNSPNIYQLTYTATNSLGLAGTAIRLVTVMDTTPPIITVIGANPLTILTNTPFVDPGATALDACGGSFAVTTNSTVNPAVAGSYTVTYSSTDSYNNTATAMRTVVVRSHFVFVTNTNDSGAGSLRQAVVTAYSGDDIQFATNLSGATILLASGALIIATNLTIDASALPGGIQINGNASQRIFNVVSNVTVVLTALTITNGFAGIFSAGGGGIYNSSGIVTVNQCLLAGNSANNSQTGGGGIFNSLGTVTVNQCTFTGNSASNSLGGGIYNYVGTVTLNQCTFTRNMANGGAGGGIVNNNGLVTVNQCTFTGNMANNSLTGGGGGGIASITDSVGVMYVNQCTLTGNSANNSLTGGGGIFNNGTLYIANSIVAGNTATNGNGADIYNFTSGLSFSGPSIAEGIYGVYSGDYSPINADPKLAPLGNYGGSTQTMPPLPGSPAIDACDTSPFATDQRGFPRIIGAFPDIGAVEGIYNTNGPGRLTGMRRLGNGSSQFTFTNLTDASFTVLASTNLALPMNTWSNLGPVIESPIGSGQFQFTDPQATNFPQRYYRVRVP
jgi:hypothetical protein